MTLFNDTQNIQIQSGGIGKGGYSTGIALSGALVLLILYLMLDSLPCLAAATLPGEDMSSKMESAGTLLRFIDTGIFRWGARLFAGLCICGSAWSLKEGRYGSAVIAVISAIMFGTAPTWVRNIFSIGGSDSVFSQVERIPPQYVKPEVIRRA